MIHNELQEVKAKVLPQLPKTYVSILKQKVDNVAVNTLESFVLKKLRHITALSSTIKQ